MVRENKTILNFYSISSNFNDVLLKLCNKVVNSEENLYVNFDKSDTKKEVDKFLWVSQKNNFLPHKTYGEKIFKKDKIILFDGCYSRLQRIERFNTLIVSPCVKIKKFEIFKKFLIFSYTKQNLFNSKIKNVISKNIFTVNWYEELSPFKWKKI
tara:strand:- start:930 stop:1391 length:462 start_codon:yes stop_codon:yes gene_type:complete